MPGPAPTAYLEGGPCAGTERKLTRAELDSGTLRCKGAVYNHTNTLHGEDIVFRYKAPVSSGNGGDANLKAPRAHKGWADLAHTVNTRWHPALKRSERLTREALRTLHRAHKVKG